MLDRFAPHTWVCLWLLSAVAGAQRPDAQPAIALEEALARTLTGSPALAAFGYRIEAAEGRLQQANIAPHPELGITVNDALGTGDFRGASSAETTLTIAWILERGVRWREIEAARADVSLRSLEAQIVQLDAAAETARRFLACLAYQARLVNAAEGVRLAAETVEAVRSRVAASRAPPAELSRAEAELVRAELLEEDYTHELLSAYHRLSAQWGDTEPDFESVIGELQTLPAMEPLPILLSRVEENPDLVRFMSQRRVSEAEMRIAEARGRPDWRLHAGVRRTEAADDFALVGGITVPFGTRERNLGRIAETRADMARAEGEARAAQVRMETALFTMYQELLHDVHLAVALSERVIPLLESALADTRRAYELGRSSYFEWSVAQAELLQANNELLETGIDVHGLVIEIERLTGVSFFPPVTAE